MSRPMPPSGRLLAALICPHCHHEHIPSVQVTAETSRRATKRPVTPEIIQLCPNCGTLLILSLHPAPQEAIAS
jgi:RNase P subunit RPR2